MSTVWTLLRPNEHPRSLKLFCGFGELVVWIVTLFNTAANIAGVTAVISACGFALEDVGPECHGKKARISWPVIFWLPGIPLKAGPTKWLIPLAAGLYQLSIR